MRTELLKEQTDRFNPTIKIWDVKLFVGRVQVIVRQAEAHHNGRSFQHILEIRNDGDGAAGANEDGVFLEDVVHSLCGGLDISVVGADNA